MSEDKAIYGDSLDKVIKGNNNIFSRLTTLENKIGAMISLYRDVVVDNSKLEKRVRKLERKDNFLGIDIDKIKIGGTD